MNATPPSLAADRPPAGACILYDGECRLCSRGAARCAALLRRLGFALAPLQSRWVATRLGASPQALSQAVRLLMPDGRVLAGVDVFLEVMGAVPLLRPVVALGYRPAIHRWLAAAYAVVARNRFRIGGRCRCAPSDPRGAPGMDRSC